MQNKKIYLKTNWRPWLIKANVVWPAAAKSLCSSELNHEWCWSDFSSVSYDEYLQCEIRATQPSMPVLGVQEVNAGTSVDDVLLLGCEAGSWQVAPESYVQMYPKRWLLLWWLTESFNCGSRILYTWFTFLLLTNRWKNKSLSSFRSFIICIINRVLDLEAPGCDQVENNRCFSVFEWKNVLSSC